MGMEPAGVGAFGFGARCSKHEAIRSLTPTFPQGFVVSVESVLEIQHTVHPGQASRALDEDCKGEERMTRVANPQDFSWSRGESSVCSRCEQQACQRHLVTRRHAPACVLCHACHRQGAATLSVYFLRSWLTVLVKLAGHLPQLLLLQQIFLRFNFKKDDIHHFVSLSIYSVITSFCRALS